MKFSPRLIGVVLRLNTKLKAIYTRIIDLMQKAILRLQKECMQMIYCYSRSPGCLRQSLYALHKACIKWGMTINVEKLKHAHISMDGHHLQNVNEFYYLGTVVNKSGGCCEEIENKIVKARTAFNFWKKPVFSNRYFFRTIKPKAF